MPTGQGEIIKKANNSRNRMEIRDTWVSEGASKVEAGNGFEKKAKEVV